MSEPQVGPEDALGTEKSKHDYSDLMRLEAPHEVVVTDDGKHVLEDQRKRVNKGDKPIDGTTGTVPGSDGSQLK